MWRAASLPPSGGHQCFVNGNAHVTKLMQAKDRLPPIWKISFTPSGRDGGAMTRRRLRHYKAVLAHHLPKLRPTATDDVAPDEVE
jgi:hypothetical protein